MIELAEDHRELFFDISKVLVVFFGVKKEQQEYPQKFLFGLEGRYRDCACKYRFIKPLPIFAAYLVFSVFILSAYFAYALFSMPILPTLQCPLCRHFDVHFASTSMSILPLLKRLNFQAVGLKKCPIFGFLTHEKNQFVASCFSGNSLRNKGPMKQIREHKALKGTSCWDWF